MPSRPTLAVLMFLLALTPGWCAADDYFDIEKTCGVTIKDDKAGEITCKSWQRGSQTVVEKINVGTCICSNNCLSVPANHYYYEDPITKTKMEENNVKLPVVLAWDHVEAWDKKDGEYLWYWSTFGLGHKESVKSSLFAAQSYVLEIDNTRGVLNDSQSNGKIFRRVIKGTEFNPTQEFYPCFFNSDRVIRWRVRPCCNDNGSNCLPEDQSAWWTFTTSPAPEPMSPKDPHWRKPENSDSVAFRDLKIQWCNATVSDEKQALNENEKIAQYYQIRVYDNENKVLNLTSSTIPSDFSELGKMLLKDNPALTYPMTCNRWMKQKDGICRPDLVEPILPKTPRIFWSHAQLPNKDRNLFTKNLTYYWQVRRCFKNTNSGDESCSQNNEKGWGQLWEFTAKNQSLDTPTAVYPPNDSDYADSMKAKLVEIPARIAWQGGIGANSFTYDIQEMKGGSFASLIGGGKKTVSSEISLAKDSSNATESLGEDVKLDTAYRWRAKSCWPSIPMGNNACEETWSNWFYFRTTGRAPKTDSMVPANNSQDVTLPATLKWEAVLGARSYNVSINGETILVKAGDEPAYTMDYPKLKQNQDYAWKVQTCVDEQGTKCGGESPESTFKTAALGASQNPQSMTGTVLNNLLDYNFTWDSVPGARYYRVVLEYTDKSDKETSNDCTTGEKLNKITSNNSITVNKDISQVYCLGKYNWSVLACLDNNCQDAGAQPNKWEFVFEPGAPESKKGQPNFMVCGALIDNPDTPFDEREECQLKHGLMVVERVINFIIFRLALILLPILGLITGAVFYLSIGGPETLELVKSTWRSIGIGYALLIFAWMIVGVLMTIAGYQGVWWKV